MKQRFEVWSFGHPEAMKQFAKDNEGSYDSENLTIDRASHIANRSTICRWDNVEKI